MDFGAEGCTIDYQTNTLYCGTNLPSGASGQNSLWAINSLTGALKWSTNSGAVVNRPVLSGGKLYVAGFNGVIMAYDPAGDPFNPGRAKPDWNTFIQLPLPFARSPWAEFRSGPLQGILLAMDIGGNLRAIRDLGTDGAILWSAAAGGTLSAGACPAGALCFRGVPVVSPSSGNIYIGRNDGRVQQLTSTGTREGVININPSASNNVDVFDPSLDLEAGPDIDRLVVAAAGLAGGNGKVTRVSVPICENTPILTNVVCGCGAGGVCGTGAVGDPFRCCNIAEDTCATASGSNPCTPSRCSVEPDCCVDFTCTDPTVFSNCGAATFTCRRDGGSLFKVPDGTACDDLQSCTSAFPAPVPLSCVGIDGSPAGSNCTRDSDCPAVASYCSGTGTATPGEGGGIVGGRCCPVGSACNFATNQCLGNNGTGATSNDVCRDGFCSSDNYSSCVCNNAGDRACPFGLTCCGGGCRNIMGGDLFHCGSCTTACSPVTTCQQGVCLPP
jgi:outer membrane protein assembly factor BamB